MNIKQLQMQEKTAAAAELLKLLSHPKRLLLLCAIIEKPLPVGELAARIGLRESSTSQQLALLREAGLVRPVRQGQVIRYHVDSREAREVVKVLHRLFCKESS